MISHTLIWLLFATCLVLSFILSGMEAGVFALSRLRIRRQMRAGKRSARVLHDYLENPENFLWTILVGNTVANFIILGWIVNILHEALDRMSELSILSQDVTKSDTDRALYQKEFAKLGAYIDDLATKDFNGVSLFGGATLNVTTDSEGNTFGMSGVDLSNTAYTTATGDDVSTTAGATTALTDVKAAFRTGNCAIFDGIGSQLVQSESECLDTAGSQPHT